MESSDNYFDALVARANDATGKNLLEEALNLWSLVREAKPSWEKCKMANDIQAAQNRHV